MRRLTPLVEPLSIDEAFLDLGGTERLHGAAPAQLLAALARRVESDARHHRLDRAQLQQVSRQDRLRPRQAARLRGDRPRPRRRGFLADKPVGWLWGVGAAMQRRLAADGITLIGQLARSTSASWPRATAGSGARLAHLARGEDDRARRSRRPRPRSISAETTFAQRREPTPRRWRGILWPLCERVVGAAQASRRWPPAPSTLKLKTGDFRLRTRSRRLADPTQLADTLFRTAAPSAGRARPTASPGSA